MTASATIDAATILQWEYKTPAMREMIIQVLRVALARDTFTTNDLPIHGEREHGGSGIAGTIIHRLSKEGILSAVGVFDGPDFIPRTVKNPGGNKIGVWRLNNSSLARTLLDRHSPELSGKTEQLGLL